jgi:hypothetical protein
MGLSEILSVVAFCLTAIVNGALFFHQKRSFDSLDKRLDDSDKRCAEMDLLIRSLQLEGVRSEALCKSVDETKARLGNLIELRSEFLERLGDYIRRGDFVRDTQILTNQIEAIHKKIDYVDTKFDRFRETTHGK